MDQTTIIFVYATDGGLFNKLTDVARKVFSPKTYPCSLCALTYGPISQRKAWTQFLTKLPIESKFLHRNEFQKTKPNPKILLPMILLKRQGKTGVLLSAERINSCHQVEELISLIETELRSTAANI